MGWAGHHHHHHHHLGRQGGSAGRADGCERRTGRRGPGWACLGLGAAGLVDGVATWACHVEAPEGLVRTGGADAGVVGVGRGAGACTIDVGRRIGLGDPGTR